MRIYALLLALWIGLLFGAARMIPGFFAAGSMGATGPTPPSSWIMSGLANTYWTKPVALEHAGDLYVGGVTRSGQIKVGSVVGGTVSDFTLATHEADDHSAPSITRMANGKLLAVYTRHNADTTIRYRISTNADDPTAWDTEATLAASGGTVSYSQCWVDSTDRVHLFFRVGNETWGHRYSDNEGSTWSAQKNFLTLTGDQIYIVTVPAPGDPDTLRMAMVGHPTISTDHDVYYAEIDLTTGDIASPGGASQVNLYDASAAALPSDFEVAFDAATESNTNLRLFDIGGGANPQIAFATFTTTANAQYRESRRVSGTWTVSGNIAAAGPPVENPVGNNYYFAGMALTDDNDVLYLAREKTDGDWPLERYAYSAGWALDATTLVGDWRFWKDSFRPMVPYNASDFPVTTMRGEYTDYAGTVTTTDFNTDVVIDPTQEPTFSETVLYEESFAGLTPTSAVSGWSVLAKSSGITNEAFTAVNTSTYYGGVTGQAQHSGGDAVLWGVTGSSAQDIVMRADMRPSGNFLSGFVCRWVNSNNRLELQVDRSTGTKTLKIIERIAGTFSETSVTFTDTELTGNNAVTLYFSVVGTEAIGRMYQNGVQLAEVTRTLSATPAAGSFGFKIGLSGTAQKTLALRRFLVVEG
jgi:hypothetical protein